MSGMFGFVYLQVPSNPSNSISRRRVVSTSLGSTNRQFDSLIAMCHERYLPMVEEKELRYVVQIIGGYHFQGCFFFSVRSK